MDGIVYDFQNLCVSKNILDKQTDQILNRLKCYGLCHNVQDLFVWWDRIIMYLWGFGFLKSQDSHYTEVATRNITPQEEARLVSRLMSEGVSPNVFRTLSAQSAPPEYSQDTLRGLGFRVFRAYPYAEQEYLLDHLF